MAERIASLAFIALTAVAGLASRCGGREEAPPKPREISFYNWEAYTDLPSLREFEKETGIRVVLKEYGTTDEALAQLQTNPGAYDVILGDAENAPLLRDTRLVAPIDFAAVPNAALVDVEPREGAQYAIPFQGCATGLAVDRSRVADGDVSWAILIDPKYRGRIALLDDMREVTDALAMIAGSMNRDGRDLRVLREIGIRLVENDVAYGDTFDNIASLLVGDKWIVMTYNGDFLSRVRERPDLRFALPSEGYRVEWDSLFVSSDTLNPAAAHAFVDYLLAPRIAARWSNAFGFRAAVRGADEFLDDRVRRDPLASIPLDGPGAHTAIYLGDLVPRYEQLYHQLKRGF